MRLPTCWTCLEYIVRLDFGVLEDCGAGWTVEVGVLVLAVVGPVAVPKTFLALLLAAFLQFMASFLHF